MPPKVSFAEVDRDEAPEAEVARRSLLSALLLVARAVVAAPSSKVGSDKACYVCHMNSRPQDTSKEAQNVQFELLRRMSPGQRIALVKRVRKGTSDMALARLRAQYPNDSARRHQLRLAALRYGDELVRRVFGWDPEVEGR